MKRELTPENIQELKDNQIFVFGSNMNGNHAGGAARLAVEKFGAIMGQAEGIQGQSYAIPTLDKDMEKVTEEELVVFLGNFGNYANEHLEKEFLLTAIGTGIAGFDAGYMAYMVLRANLPDNVTLPKEFVKIKGYKGFNPDLTCRDFQYEEGKDYEETGDIRACGNGFHFCLHPLDVFSYYPPAEVGMNKFHEVEGTGDMDVDTDDTKIACSKIHIGAELSIKSIVDAAVKFTFEKCKWKKGKSATGDYSAASATGNQGAASATGDYSAASATGNQGAASATGDYSAASATGNRGAASATGDYSAASATGNRGAASATGDYSAASATGKDSIAFAAGYECKAKGAIGCWIVLTERGEWDGDTYPIKEVKAFEVDGKKVKADTWYMLVNGQLKEV
jgi:hypothetical protein